jgi:hypothetical protein
MRFNPNKRFLDRINKIGLSLSAQGGEEFGPNQMLSNLFLKFCKFCPNLSSVSSVLFDSFAPAHLALRANLRLLYLKGPAFSIVVNSAGFPPFWPVRRGF